MKPFEFIALLMLFGGGCIPASESCPNGQKLCDGTCVDIQTSQGHCGGCNNACIPQQSCTEGACACDDNLIQCSDSCVDTASATSHCGECDSPCIEGQICDNGNCKLDCSTGLTDCDGACVDLQTSSLHCGRCSVACAEDQSCTNASCVCAEPLTECDGTCVDLNTSVTTCGSCTTACDTNQSCVSGQCECTAPLVSCEETCVDTTNNPAHCSACNQACTANEVCEEGQCVSNCNTGFTDCSGSCIDLESNSLHCGQCNETCHTEQSCSGGQCSCPGTTSLCDTSCVDITTDAQHCGDCTTVCPSPQICQGSSCGCTTGLTLCGANCVDVEIDAGHCGTCDQICPGVQHCVSGTCVATYTSNPDLNETASGMLNAALTNRNPDCRVYATDANDGDYGAQGAVDRSNLDPSAPFYPGTNVISSVLIDLVMISGTYIQDPDNPTIAGGWDYETVIPTTYPELATHCRMIHNMIPNHDFGWDVGLPSEPNVWVTEIDHDDRQVTYIPIYPQLSNPLVADDTDRNASNFMDLDGVLLNGIGIAMDSGFCYNPYHDRPNEAGNATGCGGLSVWYEIPAYTLQDPSSENMAAIFDDFFGHGFEGSYHYHAMTHPLQSDDDQTVGPEGGSALIGFAKDGFPIFGHWFVDSSGALVKASSGYVLRTYSLNNGNSRDPYVGLPANFDRGTPPTPWDIENRPGDFDSDFGLPLGRYLDDWVYDNGNTGNLDECNGATDIDGVYGYYLTDKYPFGPICTFGVHEPSFGKVPPLRWHDETSENTMDDDGNRINGH